MPPASARVDRGAFYSAARAAVAAAGRGVAGARPRRRAERRAIYATMERFELVVRIRGGGGIDLVAARMTAASPLADFGTNMTRRHRTSLVAALVVVCAAIVYSTSKIATRIDADDADGLIHGELSVIGRNWDESAAAELAGRWKSDGDGSTARAAHRIAYGDLSRAASAWKWDPDSKLPASAIGLALVVESEPALVMYDIRSACGRASHLSGFAYAAAWTIGPQEASVLRTVVAEGDALQAIGALNVASKLRVNAINLHGVFTAGLMRPEQDVRGAAFEWLSRSRIDPNDVLREIDLIAPNWGADHPNEASALRRLTAERRK